MSTDSSPRSVFIISDGTGITAETLAHSLLSQFDGLAYRQIRMPFVDSADKVAECIARIDEARHREGQLPIIVSTLVNADNAARIAACDAVVLDFFAAFIAPLEDALGRRASHSIGRGHGDASSSAYAARIEAVNFTLAHDDGVSDANLDASDVILVGVSRSGKTPTSLYLALQFGLRVANYPLIPEDFERGRLPVALNAHRAKLFGLTINPDRLASIRRERRPDSRYAALENCRWEIEQAHRLMRREGIRCLDSTTKSIEEISATLMLTLCLEPRTR